MDSLNAAYKPGKSTRNGEEQLKNGLRQPKPMIANSIAVGIQYKDGIMIGVDTTTSRQHMLTTFSLNKIFQLSDNIFCGGIGIMSDLTKSTRWITGQLKMHHIITNRRALVITAKQLVKTFQQSMQAKFMASFVIAGVDKLGVHLYTVHFDGTSEKLLFSSIGSGQFGAMSILEDRWRSDLDENEARTIMIDAVTAGSSNNSLSTFNMELCIIRNDYTVEQCVEVIKVKHLRNDTQPEQNIESCLGLNHNWIQDFELSTTIVHELKPPEPNQEPEIQPDPEPEPEPAPEPMPTASDSINSFLLSVTPAHTNLQLKRKAEVNDSAVEPPMKCSRLQ